MKFRHDRMTIKELYRLTNRDDIILDRERSNRDYTANETIQIISLLSSNTPFPPIYLKETENSMNAGLSSKLLNFIFKLIDGYYDYLEFTLEDILYKELIIYIVYDIEDSVEENDLKILYNLY